MGLLSWVIEKFHAWTDHDGTLESVLSRDQLLDNLMFYWLPATGASAARLYWEPSPSSRPFSAPAPPIRSGGS